LNCGTADELAHQLEQVKKFLPAHEWIHLDVADGIFTPHKTWNEPSAWAAFKANYNLEVHLMVEEPEKMIMPWLEAGAKRVIVHHEAIIGNRPGISRRDPAEIITAILGECWKTHAEAFLAVNPETPVAALRSEFERFHGALVLAVNPGLSGQRFQPVVLDKVSFLREAIPNGKIEVDGGINPEIARYVNAAGADIAVSTSYISTSADPGKAYEELVAAAM
jgi:ribulose-phosphate 3-epimerase